MTDEQYWDEMAEIIATSMERRFGVSQEMAAYDMRCLFTAYRQVLALHEHAGMAGALPRDVSVAVIVDYI